MAGGRWLGGDPGTGRGSGIRGGLPGPRPDQQYRPIGPQGPVGSSNNVVRARIVITYGTGETGLFQYAGNPARGNQPEAWAVPPGVTKDPYGNTLPVSGGFATQQTSTNSVAQLVNAQLQIGNLSDFTLSQVVASSGNVEVVSGRSTVADVAASLTVQSSLEGTAGIPLVVAQGGLQLAEQTSAPATPSGSGIAYVDATGHLVYKGPSGTLTVLANP